MLRRPRKRKKAVVTSHLSLTFSLRAETTFLVVNIQVRHLGRSTMKCRHRVVAKMASWAQS